MNKRLISLMAAALALLSASGQVVFSNYGEHKPIEIRLSDNHTSLNRIYVLFDTDGVEMTVNSTTGVPATWENYDYHNGNLVMQPIPGLRWNGMSTKLDRIIPNIGYKIQEGTNPPFYCWVVNYADYFMTLNDFSWGSENSCSLVSFNLDGQADAIPYYDINGNRRVLDREIKLSYDNLVWVEIDSVNYYWDQKQVVDTFAALDQAFQIYPPLCDTKFKLSGDRFLEEWGMAKEKETSTYHTQAVDCKSKAVQEKRNNDNERGLGSGMENALGGSAPVHIIFSGYPTDNVAYRVWEMATDQDFEDIILQYNQDEWDYTFNEAGNYYVRYRVANADGSCENYGETFYVLVSESQLECPNVFSPGSTPGVNDIWKVSYKSLVEFHCWIFNRWGNLVYEYTDPGGGWDGTYNGKLVDTGVYYYVITATGGDGVKYKRRGDITILRYKRGAEGTSNGVQGGGGTGGL